MKVTGVVCSRNDNYGGHLHQRATHCLNSMIDTFDEVWYIDWGSPTHSMLWDIEDGLELKGNLYHMVIPQSAVDVMTRFDPHAQKCCEVLARNLGIRRALDRGTDWLVSTNIDVIAPRREDLLTLLNDLDEDTFWTLSRRETPEDWHENWPGSLWRDFRDHLYETVPPREFGEKLHSDDDFSMINCCGDFQIAKEHVWKEVRGFEESMIYSLFTDTNIQAKAVAHGFNLKAIYEPPIFHIYHGQGGGGYMTGINKKTNDPRKMSAAMRTENSETWGFSTSDIEWEVL